jgi:hypothetical protein
MQHSGLRFKALLCSALGAFSLLVLGGCATTRIIDSEVRSFAGSTPPTQPASYRFERLPSQDLQSYAQERLETIAQPLLESVGLRKAVTEPKYALVMKASVEAIENPTYSRSWKRQQWLDRDGFMRLPSMGLMLEPSWQRYSVSLVLRDIASSQTVFESSAQHMGPWSDTQQLLPAVIRAALSDYPNAQPQPHSVFIEVSPTVATSP